MIKAAVLENDEARVRALLEYDILDTDAEKDYDDITLLASEICQTPISSIAFFDSDRQVLKANLGLPPGITPREMSFCGHVINSNEEVFVIPDSRKDERFFDNPAVTGPTQVIFYAGVRLQTPEGYSLGTLCVIDNKPRELNERQLSLLKALANQLVQLLALRKRNIEIKKIARELEARANELEEMNKELEAFNRTVSHDLQSPLRIMSGFSRMLSKKYNDKLDDTGKEYLDLICGSAARMNTLICDLLDFAKLGKASLKREEIDMKTTMESVIKEVRMAHVGITPEIKMYDLKPLEGDLGLIRQVLTNLVGNAVKYSSKKLKPVIELGNETIGDENIYFVKDNGAGFDMQNYDKLFGVFQRLHTENEFTGTGVGLATVHRIITKHGGRIWAESKPEEGSTFYFTIPCAA